MLDSIRKFEPVLPYPSRQSMIDLMLATIERNSSADLPNDWPENEPLYLQENDIVSSDILQEVLDDVINGAEPAPWLLRDLKEFEQTLVASVFEDLENSAEGRTFLEIMRSTAISNAQAQSSQEQHSNDAEQPSDAL